MRLRDGPPLPPCDDEVAPADGAAGVDARMMALRWHEEWPPAFAESAVLRATFRPLARVAWRRVGVLDRPFMAHIDIIVRSLLISGGTSGDEVLRHICASLASPLA